MGVYTFAELEWLFIHAGGGVTHAPVAAAIALAESGGCQYALAGPLDIRPFPQCVYRQTLQENSFGLWQVNLFAHPQYELGNQGRNLFRALVNAEAAVAISSQGRSFGAWSTYTNGAWRSRMPATIPAPSAPGEDAVLGPMLQPGALKDPPNHDDQVFKAWDEFTHALGSELPAGLKRATYFTHLMRSAVRL